MRPNLLRIAPCLLGVLLLFPLAGWAAPARIVLGILPVYDSSAEPVSDRLSPNLALFLYQNLQKSPDITPVLLSPGGTYDPESEEWIENYGSRLKIDAVLISRILPTIRINDHSVKLNVEIEMLDLASGKRAAKQTNTTIQLGSNDFFANVAATYVNSTYVDFRANPKEFAKQPLGKATQKLADWARDYSEDAAKTLQLAGTGEEPRPAVGSCSINVRILYTARRASAKSYNLLANNEDESSTIKEGIATFNIPAGPLVLRYQVNDAPYRLPTQKYYQSSTIVDCTSGYRTLRIELGTAGEATPVWE